MLEFMHACLHVYMSVYMVTHTHESVHMYVNMYVYICKYEYRHTDMLYACRYVCMIDMCMCIYACMNVYMWYICIQTCINLYVYVWMYTFISAQMYACMYICLCTYMWPNLYPVSLYTYLTYNWKIWLPHWKYEPLSHYAIWIYSSNIYAYVCKNTTNCNTNFTCYCHAWACNKYAPQIPHLCHIYKLFYVQIWHNYDSINSWEAAISINWYHQLGPIWK